MDSLSRSNNFDKSQLPDKVVSFYRVVEYLRELRERFKTAEQYASSHAAKKQAQYTTRYNLRSQDKVFSVGEQVLVLVPDSTASKTFSRWQGPATVVSK